jgi:hypothetical protein
VIIAGTNLFGATSATFNGINATMLAVALYRGVGEQSAVPRLLSPRLPSEGDRRYDPAWQSRLPQRFLLSRIGGAPPKHARSMYRMEPIGC